MTIVLSDDESSPDKTFIMDLFRAAHKRRYPNPSQKEMDTFEETLRKIEEKWNDECARMLIEDIDIAILDTADYFGNQYVDED